MNKKEIFDLLYRWSINNNIAIILPPFSIKLIEDYQKRHNLNFVPEGFTIYFPYTNMGKIVLKSNNPIVLMHEIGHVISIRNYNDHGEYSAEYEGVKLLRQLISPSNFSEKANRYFSLIESFGKEVHQNYFNSKETKIIVDEWNKIYKGE